MLQQKSNKRGRRKLKNHERTSTHRKRAFVESSEVAEFRNHLTPLKLHPKFQLALRHIITFLRFKYKRDANAFQVTSKFSFHYAVGLKSSPGRNADEKGRDSS